MSLLRILPVGPATKSRPSACLVCVSCAVWRFVLHVEWRSLLRRFIHSALYWTGCTHQVNKKRFYLSCFMIAQNSKGRQDVLIKSIVSRVNVFDTFLISLWNTLCHICVGDICHNPKTSMWGQVVIFDWPVINNVFSVHTLFLIVYRLSIGLCCSFMWSFPVWSVGEVAVNCKF